MWFATSQSPATRWVRRYYPAAFLAAAVLAVMAAAVDHPVFSATVSTAAIFAFYVFAMNHASATAFDAALPFAFVVLAATFLLGWLWRYGQLWAELSWPLAVMAIVDLALALGLLVALVAYARFMGRSRR